MDFVSEVKPWSPGSGPKSGVGGVRKVRSEVGAERTVADEHWCHAPARDPQNRLRRALVRRQSAARSAEGARTAPSGCARARCRRSDSCCAGSRPLGCAGARAQPTSTRKRAIRATMPRMLPWAASVGRLRCGVAIQALLPARRASRALLPLHVEVPLESEGIAHWLDGLLAVAFEHARSTLRSAHLGSRSRSSSLSSPVPPPLHRRPKGPVVTKSPPARRWIPAMGFSNPIGRVLGVVRAVLDRMRCRI